MAEVRHHPPLKVINQLRREKKLWKDSLGREYGTVEDENNETLWFVHLPNIVGNDVSVTEYVSEPIENEIVILQQTHRADLRARVIEYPERSPERTKIITLDFVL